MSDTSGVTEEVSLSQERGQISESGVARRVSLSRGRRVRATLWSWTKLILLILALRWLLIEPFTIPTGSMEPTLHGSMEYFKGDRVAVNKLAYGVRIPFTEKLLFKTWEPKRWDIVVFRTTEAEPAAGTLQRLKNWALPTILIKRVVGLPGERVHISGGKVYVNGAPLTLPDTMPPVHYTSNVPGAGDYTVREVRPGQFEVVRADNTMKYGILDDDAYSLIPSDAYFLLGDNSGSSKDGRFFGWVPREHLLGRAFAIWWPLPRRRDFTGFSDTWWGMGLLYGLPLALVLHEIIVSFVVRSWRLRHDLPEKGFRSGDRVLIDCKAYGWRLPFTRWRVVGARSPMSGDIVLYEAPKESEWKGLLLLGRVLHADPQDASRYVVESVEGAGYPDSRDFGSVPGPDIIGRAGKVWWPARASSKAARDAS